MSLGKTPPCYIPIDRTAALSGLDLSPLREQMQSNFYNPNLLEFLTCLFKIVLYTPSQFEYLREWFQMLTEIGATSVNGQVLAPLRGAFAEAVVIKVPRHGSDLTHEYLIGVSGTNRLRAEVPNFVYVLGAFRCAAPNINPDRSVAHWCTTDEQKVSYVLYERIFGPALMDVAATVEWVEYLGYIAQLAFALKASEYLSFVHHDLHDGNVLLRELEQPVYLPYTYREETIYLSASRIATIIDYGHAEFAESDFPYEEDPRLADLYRLIMYSLFRLLTQKNPIFTSAAALASFFGLEAETLPDFLWTQQGYQRDPITGRYQLGGHNTRFVMGPSYLTLDDFLDFLRDHYPMLFIEKSAISADQILHCDNQCLSLNEYRQLFHLVTPPPVASLREALNQQVQITPELKARELSTLKQLNQAVVSGIRGCRRAGLLPLMDYARRLAFVAESYQEFTTRLEDSLEYTEAYPADEEYFDAFTAAVYIEDRHLDWLGDEIAKVIWELDPKLPLTAQLRAFHR